MKTALIKSTLWNDDSFYELNIDTKLLYLLILSSPERGVSHIYKTNDRLLSAQSGLTIDQIRICKTQLQDRGLILFKDGYICLSQGSYIAPKKGRFTDQAIQRELQSIPEDVVIFFTAQGVNNENHVPEEHICAPVHIYKDNNKDIDKDNNNYINEISVLYYQVITKMHLPVLNHNTIRKKIKAMSSEDEPDKIKSYLLFLRDKYSTLDFEYKPSINDAIDIYRKRVQIINAVKQEVKNSDVQRIWRPSP